MRDFFLNLNQSYFINLFSINHCLLILITGIILFLIIKNKSWFQNLNSNQKHIFRYLFATILIINMILRRGSFIYYGAYDWHNHLDINFCNFTSIMFIIYAISGDKKILNISYYMSFVGPLIAIMLPSTNLNPLGYSFYSFLILHHFVFIFSFIFMFMENMEWQRSNLGKTAEFLIIYFCIIFLFDYFFEVNYNMPLTFVNSSILDKSFINVISQNNIIVYIIYFLIISFQLFIGDKISKIITKKRVN